MSVIRVNNTKGFTVMSNYHFQDKEISLKAKGLLGLMLSLPSNWDYSVNGLVAIVKENKAAVQTALKELEEHKYLKRTRVQDETGRFDLDGIMLEYDNEFGLREVKDYGKV